MTGHARVKRAPILIADDQVVVPAFQVAAYLNKGRTLAEAGREFGVSASTISRFLRDCGYRRGRTWVSGNQDIGSGSTDV